MTEPPHPPVQAVRKPRVARKKSAPERKPLGWKSGRAKHGLIAHAEIDVSKNVK